MDIFHSFFEAFPHKEHIMLSMSHASTGRRVVGVHQCGMEYWNWMAIVQKLTKQSTDECRYHDFAYFSPSSMVEGVNRFYDQYKEQGFRKEYGSKLTMASPVLIHYWDRLTSASITQLQAVKDLGMDHLILEALYRQGFITGVKAKPMGPSVVETRWTPIFPEVFSMVPVLQTLKIPFVQAKEMLRPTPGTLSNEAENFDFS